MATDQELQDGILRAAGYSGDFYPRAPRAEPPAPQASQDDPLSGLTPEERALLEKFPNLRKDFDAELAPVQQAAAQARADREMVEERYAIHDARAALRAAARRIAGGGK